MIAQKFRSVLIATVLFAAGIFIISSCTKTPVPAFSYSPVSNPEAGDTIKFTNASLDATSYFSDDTGPSRCRCACFVPLVLFQVGGCTARRNAILTLR